VKLWVKGAIALADAATVAGIIALWQSDSANTASYLSKPSAVATAIRVWLTNPTLLGYIPVTLWEAAAGMLIALAAATVLASLLASSSHAADIFEPFMALGNAAPRIALAPLFLLVFGTDLKSKVIFVATSVVFIPFFAIFRAITTVDQDLLNNARCLGARRFSIIREVYIPAVTSSVVASLRVTVAFSLLTAILAEYLSSQAGIGYEIQQAQNNLQANYAIAGVIIIALIAVCIDLVLRLVERRALVWRDPS
jgi:ABC-type nitrate/sulfonate/bicarbonate transport system permease component